MRKVVQFSENQIVYSGRDGEIKLEPDKFYKVTKGNSDRSVLAGDVIFIKGKKSMNLVSPEDSRLYRREMNGARKVSVFC